jgi:AMMECR1 domain-containing protein
VATLFSAVAFGFTVKFGLDIVTLSTSPGKKEAVRGCVGTKKPSNGSGPEAGKRSEGY